MNIDSIVIAQVLTTAVAFILFFWIAKKLFWTSILRLIEERQMRIRSEFERIDQLQTQVNALEADYNKRISQIEVEARQKMQAAIANGKQIADQIAEDARKDASAQIERTKQSIQIEMEKARAELREEVVQMTLRATEKLLNERLDDRKQRELVTNFINEVEKK